MADPLFVTERWAWKRVERSRRAFFKSDFAWGGESTIVFMLDWLWVFKDVFGSLLFMYKLFSLLSASSY